MARIGALKPALKFALTVGLITAAALSGGFAQARSGFEQTRAPWLTDRSVDAAAVVRLWELPREGRETYERIRQGGPFPYEKDGMVFGNRERALPAARRGFYREYTVRTPGSRDRGARRIVCGGPVRAPQACWYTADHYASFRQITE